MSNHIPDVVADVRTETEKTLRARSHSLIALGAVTALVLAMIVGVLGVSSGSEVPEIAGRDAATAMTDEHGHGHEHGHDDRVVRHLADGSVRVVDYVRAAATARGARGGLRIRVPRRVDIGETITVTGRAKVSHRTRLPRRSRPVGVRATGPSGSGPSSTRGQTTRRGTLRLRIFMGAVPGTRRVTVSVRRSDGLPAATRSVLVTVVDPNEPTDPGTEEPTDPGTEEPTDPGTEEPTDPGSEEPTDPGTEEPTGPQGDPNDWTYLFENGSRWNTCQPTFGWGYDPEGAPYATALDDLHVAFDRVEAATGLDFVYQGAQGDDINVDWGTEAEYPGLAGSVVGGAFTHSYPVTGYDVGNQIVHGGFFLDADATASPGTHHPRYTTWGQVMVHELLHVMGLHHSRSPAQLMHAAAGASNQDLGRGDLSGAAAVGAGHPCLPMSYERPEPDQSGQGSRRAGGTTKRIG